MNEEVVRSSDLLKRAGLSAAWMLTSGDQSMVVYLVRSDEYETFPVRTIEREVARAFAHQQFAIGAFSDRLPSTRLY
jgi:hypothetical protein